MRNGLHQARRPQSPSAGRHWRLYSNGRLREVFRALAGAPACPPERRANPGTLPPQPPGRQSHYDAAHDRTEHYYRAEQLLAEASQIITFRQQPGQSGPADLPERPTDAEERRKLSSDPGLPERTIAEAQVHATLALAAATAVAGLGPDSRAWADVAGTKLSSG
jgi:hypothetical protein